MRVGCWFFTPYISDEIQGWPNPPAIYESTLGQLTNDQAFEQAQVADSLGFDWISVSEHHNWGIIPTPNPAVTLGALSKVLKRAELAWLGPLVSMNNPVRIAEEIAVLDQLSNGRTMVVFLRGTPNEFLAYDTNPDETRGRSQEAIELILHALREPQPFTWEGRYFRFRTVSVWPRMANPDRLLFAAGNSEQSAAFAARHRLGLGLSFYSAERCAGLVDIYRREAAEAGWQPTSEHILYRSFVCLGESDAHAQELRTRYHGRNGGFFGGLQGRAAVVAGALTTEAGGLEAFWNNILRISGGPETVIERITELHDAIGMGHLDIGFNGGGLPHEESMASMRLFADEVRPGIDSLGAVEAQAAP